VQLRHAHAEVLVMLCPEVRPRVVSLQHGDVCSASADVQGPRCSCDMYTLKFLSCSAQKCDLGLWPCKMAKIAAHQQMFRGPCSALTCTH
jgi:hypothetical protein